MKRGDPVTERGIWLRATVQDFGPEQTVLCMEDHILHQIPREHTACTKDLIPWAEFQKDRGESYLRGNKNDAPNVLNALAEKKIPYQRGKFVHECQCGVIFPSAKELEIHKSNCYTLKGWYK